MKEEPDFRVTYWCVKHERHMEKNNWSNRCGFDQSDEEYTCEPQLMVMLPIREGWLRY